MGLDMYLEGEIYLQESWDNPDETVTLGYWRKHPDLHGFIVNEFAGGEDKCQKIELDQKRINKIIKAIKNKSLPKTTGFFFGESDGSEDEESIEIFQAALGWLRGGQYRTINYKASW